MKMKKLLIATLILGTALLMAACNENDNPVYPQHEPLTPQGIYSITGNHAVYVYFNGVYDTDVSEYLVYRSYTPDNGYAVVGHVAAESNPYLDLLIYEYVDQGLTNGTTYYYAVASVDNEGRVSELSAENVYDTPRPEGTSTVFPMEIEPTLSGYSLAAAARVSYDSPAADIYIDQVTGVDYINVGNAETDIMDMGYTKSFDEISVSPSISVDSGWSAVGYYEVVPGHTYVIWTSDNHFAKVRIDQINGSGSIGFHWAYQTDTGNPELVAPQGGWKRPYHSPDFLKKFVAQANRAQ
jgi:hypothetical protein